MTAMIRILLADDQELIRLGFRLVLDAEPDLSVIGEAVDGDDAVRRALELRPDIVLMDIRMPGTDGIEATARLAREAPDVKVLVLTTFDLDDYAFGALQAGASGFLLKDARRDELVSAVRAVQAGDAMLSPRITRRLIERVNAQAGAPAAVDRQPAPLPALTEREHEVFVAIGRGRTNAEIARELFVSESTVKTHVGRVLAKLGARDRVHAVILAHRHRIVSSDDAPPQAP